ncbi:unnamed protein product [Schistocephalus solidus]|uniref:Reverse transcriptase domain-containing protein n=1 Tax=Schistocephalus solidus TaxID=70667 RepID=A0A183SYT6_SCHSO|nr:unnamed protein product [Schistocephalus solidus]
MCVLCGVADWRTESQATMAPSYWGLHGTPTPWDPTQIWWYTQGRLRPRQPPVLFPIFGLLYSVLTLGSDGGGGDSAVAAVQGYYLLKLIHEQVIVPAPPGMEHTVDLVEINGRTVICITHAFCAANEKSASGKAENVIFLFPFTSLHLLDMLATVEIDVVGPDMYTASRHAQSIAENFLADVDDFQRASREADRRAMSHFDTVASSEVGLASGYPRTRRSFSVVRYGMPTNSDYGRTRYWSSSVDPVRQSTYAPSVTLVGSRYPRRQDYIPQYGYLPTKKVYDRPYPYSYYYPGRYYSYPSSYFYDDYVPASRYLHNYYPRTYLSQLPNYYNHYASRHYPYDGCNDILPTSHLHASTGPKPNWNNSSLVAPTPRVHHAHRGLCRTSRYGSVPHVGLSLPTSQRATSVAPPPRHFYAHDYSDLTEETPSHYSFYRKMDNLLDYQLPSADYFTAFRSSLRSVMDKMDQHRTLLDRYTAIDMTNGPASIEERGYGPPFVAATGGPTSELRGRIKRLLCRSHKDPHHFRYFPQAAVRVRAT